MIKLNGTELKFKEFPNGETLKVIDMLEVIFEDGVLYNQQSLAEIRARVGGN